MPNTIPFLLTIVVGVLLIIDTLLSLLYGTSNWYSKILDFPRPQLLILSVICFIAFAVLKKDWHFPSIALASAIVIQSIYIVPNTFLGETSSASSRSSSWGAGCFSGPDPLHRHYHRSVPAAVMAIVNHLAWWPFSALLGLFVFVQLLENYFLTPKTVGSKVRLNPLFTLIAVLVGSYAWGLAGMILSIPFQVMQKVIFDHVEPLHPYGT